MTKTRVVWAFWGVVVLCVAALVASSLLLVDYVRPAPVFCAPDGGCAVVKATIFAHPLGVPMPVYGIGGFLAIGLLQLIPGRRARISQAMLAVFGGIVAAGLIGVQLLMKTMCPFCAVADGAAVCLTGLSLLRAVRGWDPPSGRRALAGGISAVLAAVVVPLAIGMAKKPIVVTVADGTIPPVIAEEMKKTPRTKVTVVDFVDFECPFCRMTHAELGPLLAERKDKVRVTRKHVPLRMHPHAMDAARAACCGEKLGKGDEMAESLFTVTPENLTPEGCQAIAEKLGLDVTQFRDCFKDPSIDARIHADTDTFKAAHGHGLPTIYIDGTKLEGAPQPGVLASTLDSAIRAL